MAEDADQWVWLARIRRPQGRKGEVFADILSDFPEKFSERRRLWLLAASMSAHAGRPSSHSVLREIELTNHWLHKGGIVLHFSGVDSISAAEALNGLIVAIPRAERAALSADEIYISDLIGCTLFDVAGLAASSDPIRSSQPMILAGLIVTARSAASRSIPSLTASAACRTSR